MADATAESGIQAVQEVYRIGYLNEEVRISYKKDVRMTVGSIAIDAREGDMSSLPRWAAKMLAEQGAVEIQSNDSAGYISKTLNRESLAKSNDLSGIDVDFYVRVNEYLESLNERERENQMEALDEFVDSRLAKISKLATAGPLSVELEKKLSVEERETYQLINNAAMAFRSKVIKKFG